MLVRILVWAAAAWTVGLSAVEGAQDGQPVPPWKRIGLESIGLSAQVLDLHLDGLGRLWVGAATGLASYTLPDNVENLTLDGTTTFTPGNA